MKNRFFNLVLIAATSVSVACGASAVFAEEPVQEATEEETSVEETSAEETDSSLYEVTLTLDPKDFPDVDIKAVGFKGGCLFYESNLTDHTDSTGMVDLDTADVTGPEGYKEGMEPIGIGGFYYEDMTLQDDGTYAITLNLPAGVYPYTFVINPDLGEPDPDLFWANLTLKDGSKKGFNNLMEYMGNGFAADVNKWVADPDNKPYAPTPTGGQTECELFVGPGSASARTPIDDTSKQGILSYESYTDVDGNEAYAGIYLPAGYDESKTYPLIIVSHGGGGNEVDWFHQGNLNNIMDNMIAEGRTKEAIVVTPNNTVYDWDFEKIAKNIKENLIPYVESKYSISEDVNDRAFCGLSMGSMTTLYMYYHYPEMYNYFGAFSGGMAPGNDGFSLDNPRTKEVKLLIGSGEEDTAYNTQDIGVPPTIAALEEAGVNYESYFVPGSHDWFTWPAMFEYFAENTLWK